MPDTLVDIPFVGQVAFPASMSDADIEKAAAKLHQDGLDASRNKLAAANKGYDENAALNENQNKSMLGHIADQFTLGKMASRGGEGLIGAGQGLAIDAATVPALMAAAPLATGYAIFNPRTTYNAALKAAGTVGALGYSAAQSATEDPEGTANAVWDAFAKHASDPRNVGRDVGMGYGTEYMPEVAAAIKKLPWIAKTLDKVEEYAPMIPGYQRVEAARAARAERAAAKTAEAAAAAKAAEVVPSTVGPHAGGYVLPSGEANVPEALAAGGATDWMANLPKPGTPMPWPDLKKLLEGLTPEQRDLYLAAGRAANKTGPSAALPRLATSTLGEAAAPEAAAPAAAPTSSAAPATPFLNGDEFRAAQKLVDSGKTPGEAYRIVKAKAAAPAAPEVVLPPTAAAPQAVPAGGSTPAAAVAGVPAAGATAAAETSAAAATTDKAAKAIVRDLTSAELTSLSKLPEEEGRHYLQLRQLGDSHTDAMATVNHTRDALREAETAQNARAMLGSNTATSELYGNESDAAKAKLAELTAGTGRSPHVMVNEAMDERYQNLTGLSDKAPWNIPKWKVPDWLKNNPQAAWLLPLLGIGTLGETATRKD